MPGPMRIHKLVNEALKAVEQARAEEVSGRDPRPYIEVANDILKNQIGKHPDRRAFFTNKSSPFLEVYLELLQRVDQAMYPLDDDFHKSASEPQPDLDLGIERLRIDPKSDFKSDPTSGPKSDIKSDSKSIDPKSDPTNAQPKTKLDPQDKQLPPIPGHPDPNNTLPLAERFAQIRRKSIPDRKRPPIPQTHPILKMPEAPVKAQAQTPPKRPQVHDIQAPVLHKLLLELSDRVLIIDIRDRASYNEFHIDVPHTACLEFFSISKAETEQDLEDSLVVAPKKDQAAFSFRSTAKLVVLVDDQHDPHPETIERVKMALHQLKIVVLQGGIQAWKAYSLPLARSTPSPEPPTPFTEQLTRDGTIVIRGGMVQAVPQTQQPIQLVQYPAVREQLQSRGNYTGAPPAIPPHGLSRPTQHGHQAQMAPQHSQAQYHHQQHYQAPQYPAPQYTAPHPAPQHQLPQHSAPHPHQQHSQRSAPHLSTSPQLICGLKNLGNTCYMNCILQCLFGTPELITPFLNGVYQRYINPKSRLGYSGRLAHEFARLVALVARSGQQQQFVAPFEFKQLVGQLQDTFLGYDQQDCQEFLTFLLDGLHEDLNSRGDAPHEPPLSDAQEKVRESYDVRVAAACEWERYMKTNASLVVDEIQGQYASRLECTVCHSTSTTYTAFSTLTLPLKVKKTGSIDLIQCFDAFLAPALLEGDNAWNCPTCKKKQKTVQYLKISRLPKILIIHLKRFRQKRSLSGSTTADKLEVSVRYPLYHLDLTKYWTQIHELNERDAKIWRNLPSRSQDPPFIYDLYAVTSHHGSLKSGHYTAFVNKEPNGWFYFDDTNVVPLRDNNVVTRNAYVLFYRRRENLRR